MQRLLAFGRWLFLAVLLLAAVPVAARTVQPVEVQVVVRSSRSGPDAISFVYSSPAQGAQARQSLEAQARQDYQRLAAALGQPAAPVKVTTASEPAQAPPTTSAEGKLQNLVNRSAGWLNIGPLLKVFSRYDRLSLTYFVEPPFQFRGPRGPFDNPNLAMNVEEGDLLELAAKQRASDIFLKAGVPPALRLHGRIAPTDYPVLEGEEVRQLAYSIMSPQQIARFEQRHEADLAFTREGLARFRANVYQQRGHVGMVLRLIPLELPSRDELGMPPVLKQLPKQRQA